MMKFVFRAKNSISRMKNNTAIAEAVATVGPLPEWPHTQCVGLAYPWTRVRDPVAAASLAICSPHLHRAMRGAQGVLPIRVGVRPVNWIYRL